MEEPSDRRVDLSNVHPMKRLTLVVLWLMFGMSIALAVCTQCAWASGVFGSPVGELTIAANRVGLTLILRAPRSVDVWGWHHRQYWGAYSDSGFAFIPWDVADYSYEYLVVSNEPLVPGFYWIKGWQSYSICIDHFWLIGISAVLYFLTRRRIRRSVRVQRLPS
jgi:hypothetical protein